MKELSEMDRRMLYTITRLQRDDSSGATPGMVAAALGVTVNAANSRLARLRRAGYVRHRKGYEVVVSGGAESLVREMQAVEREISDALRSNLSGFQMDLRLRGVLRRIRAAIEAAS